MDLVTAQKRLMEMRQERGLTPSPRPVHQPIKEEDWGRVNAVKLLHECRVRDGLVVTEAAVTEVVTMKAEASPNVPMLQLDDFVKVYPAMVKLLAQSEHKACLRMYLLIKWLDAEGCGWLDAEALRETLELYGIYGWRRARQVLAQGSGTWWEWDGERVWYRSVGKVCYATDAGRVGHPVLLPSEALLGSLANFNAHVFAVRHTRGRHENNPVSQRVIRELSGVPERTQRRYNKRAGVKSQRNYGIMERLDDEAFKKRAREQFHRGVFHFHDANGQQGPPQGNYVAIRLPNAYEPLHERANPGMQKKYNQQSDLFMKGMTGNDEIVRCFFDNGGAAAKVANRHGSDGLETDIFWPSTKAQRKPSVIWLAYAKNLDRPWSTHWCSFSSRWVNKH